jgi:hypothetical protein
VQQLETPPVGVNFDTGQVDLAWAPDSRRLAMVSGHGAAASLTVVGRGRVPVLLARKLVFQPAWSPDGRLVTGFVGRGINAYRATGGLAWRAPTSDFVFVPWSKQGAVLDGPARPHPRPRRTRAPAPLLSRSHRGLVARRDPRRERDPRPRRGEVKRGSCSPAQAAEGARPPAHGDGLGRLATGRRLHQPADRRSTSAPVA